MKRVRLLLLMVAAAALTFGGWWWRQRASRQPAFVPIQDGKTLDFSSGHAVVKDTPEDRAALERALKEMDEATKDVTFPATKPAAVTSRTELPKKE